MVRSRRHLAMVSAIARVIVVSMESRTPDNLFWTRPFVVGSITLQHFHIGGVHYVPLLEFRFRYR